MSQLIIALDFPTSYQALEFVKPLSPKQCKLKVGLELFVSAGPDFIKQLTDQGFDIFLDLKFHDIPNTVGSVCSAAAKLGVWMMNVHASGGTTMMKTAKAAIDDQNSSTKLIAVTVLTSMNNQELASMNIKQSASEQVSTLASLTKGAGLDGIVCSAQEAEMLRKDYGKEFLLVTPGIRPAGSATNDQSRIMTPGKAIQAGSSYIVVGRPITQSDNPIGVIEHINQEIADHS